MISIKKEYEIYKIINIDSVPLNCNILMRYRGGNWLDSKDYESNLWRSCRVSSNGRVNIGGHRSWTIDEFDYWCYIPKIGDIDWNDKTGKEVYIGKHGKIN
jgi:hypothetical protein